MAETVAQMGVPAPGVVYPLVEGLVAHHGDAESAAPPDNLLGTPLQGQFVARKLLHSVRETDVFGFLAHPFLVLLVRQFRVVGLGIPVAVAVELAVDGASVDPQLFGNLRLGHFLFLHPRNFVPLHFG